MKKLGIGLILGMFVSLLLAVTAVDSRDSRFPVAKYSTTQLSWVASDANDKSSTIANLNGTIERIDIVVSDGNVTQNATVSFADEGGTALASFTVDMNSVQRLLKLATSDSTDFNAIPCCGNLVVTVDPSNGPTGVTWTVDVSVYVE